MMRGFHFGPCSGAFAFVGPFPFSAWGAPWWGLKQSREAEKRAVAEYIEWLKDELREAEAYQRELEGREPASDMGH
jgi:outer membrane protein TolC